MTHIDLALLRIIRDDLGVALPVVKRWATAAWDREEDADWSAVEACLRLHHAHSLVSGLIDCETKSEEQVQ